MPKDMDHNEFDFIDDLIQPFHQFLKQCNISVEVEGQEGQYISPMNENKLGQFKFPEELYMPPTDFPKQNSNSTLWNWILRKFMWYRLNFKVSWSITPVDSLYNKH